MKTSLLIFFLLCSTLLFSQQTMKMRFATVTAMKAYAGPYQSAFVAENNENYEVCSVCTADEVFTFAGVRGRKWQITPTPFILRNSKSSGDSLGLMFGTNQMVIKRIAAGTGITITKTSDSLLTIGTTGLQSTISLTTTGTSGAATFVGNVLNIPQYTGGGGDVTLTGAQTFTGLKTFAPSTGTTALLFTGDILPTADNLYDVGSSTERVKTAYFNTARVGNIYNSYFSAVTGDHINFLQTDGSTQLAKFNGSNGSAIFGTPFTDIPTAQLAVNSTTKGFLPPRMTSAQRTAISSPVTGLVLYDTDSSKLFLFNGSWTSLSQGNGGGSTGPSITPQTLTDGATITWDVSAGINANVTIAATGRTLSITNPVAGSYYTLRIIQDGTGSRTITTWPTNTKWPGGVAPTLTTTAAASDIVVFYYNGTNYYANFNADFK